MDDLSVTQEKSVYGKDSPGKAFYYATMKT